jgi:signal peptidase I
MAAPRSAMRCVRSANARLAVSGLAAFFINAPVYFHGTMPGFSAYAQTMRIAREIADWAAQAIVLVFVTSAVAMPYVIPSGSMESTLMTGDHVIVDKIAYAPPGGTAGKILPYQPVHRGDIVVFRYPLDIRRDFVKRIVALPGDRLHLSHGVLYRNGAPVNESYVQHIATNYDPWRDDFPNAPAPPLPDRALSMVRNNVSGGELIIPEGSYFGMGDNRDDSSDSRYWGLIPRENITGKPVIVFWSYDAPTEDLLEFSPHHFLDLAEHFFTRTRWKRTFLLVRAG